MVQNAGLTQCIGDPGCFHNKEVIISTHVDDMMACGSKEVLDDVETSIEKTVELEKLGLPTKLLGMELTWSTNYGDRSVKLTQRNSIEKLEKEHGLTSQTIPKKSLPLNPAMYNPPSPEDEALNEEGKKKYQSLVGSLLYINRCTRPEISVHVNLLGRRTANPSQSNMIAVICILRYLASSKEEGITLTKTICESFEKTKELKTLITIEAYADASYGGDQARSQSGSLVTLNGNAILWNSRRQDTVALSITEAEYIACSETAKDIRWMQQLLNEVMNPQSILQTSTLHTDNEAALRLTKTQTFHRRTRHIEHRFHYLRQLTSQKWIKMKGIPGKENPADILTKLIPMITVVNWKKRWMLHSGIPWKDC